jgi:hypothetical protein
MASYPDMRELARLATERYMQLESLEQIKPPYPGHGSPNWWALRLRCEELLEARIRKGWRGAMFQPDWNHARSEAAKWSAIGNEDADRDYQRDGKSRDEWVSRWNPAGKISGRVVPPTLKAMP